MTRSGDWALTRHDLWAIPGIVLMVAGLILQITYNRGVGGVLLFAGVVCNTVFVFRRAGRERRRADERRGR